MNIRQRSRPFLRWLWLERAMALVALVNLGLVLFDLSYIPWRDWYLRTVPSFTQWYGGEFKGIEPHRDTQAYLSTVDRLKEQVVQTGLGSTETAAILNELRSLSHKMVDENPFEIANKSGLLERIKNEMRDRLANESSKQAFTTFWSQEYLKDKWSSEIAFFDRTIRPLMQRNYYRSIDETGGFVDQFWAIDRWFIALFAVEWLLRTFYLSRRPGTNWLDALIWRWYDLFLLLPFWRWLRIIPVVIRLHRSKLLNLEFVRTRINHGLVASVSVELTEIVVLRIIEQTQNLIRQGTVTRWLLQPEEERRQYIDVNGVDELEAIATRMLSVLAQRVLPAVQPELEALIQHNLNRVLQQLPIYNGLQQVPGLQDLPTQLTARVAAEISNTTYSALISTLGDAATVDLTRRLMINLVDTFKTEIQSEDTLTEIESLVTVLLEEIKINYVQQINPEDVTRLRQQTYQIATLRQGKNPSF